MIGARVLAAILLWLGKHPLMINAEDLPALKTGLHEIEATGWGVSPPAGFIPAEGMSGAWKPSPSARSRGPLARNSLIRVYSAFSEEACRPACAGQPVPRETISRAVIRGKPAESFHCRSETVYFGLAWPYSDFTIVHLDENSCAILALLARSGEGRHQALPTFAGMRKTLAPLPKPARKPAEGDPPAAKVPLLR